MENQSESEISGGCEVFQSILGSVAGSDLFAGATTAAIDFSVDVHFHFELRLMVGAARLDGDVFGQAVMLGLRPFLQAAFGVRDGRVGDEFFSGFLEEREDEVADGFNARLEVKGTHQGFESSAKDDIALTGAGSRFPPSQAEGASQVNLTSKLGQLLGADKGRAHSR
jgi:hypothetical protein